jgi:uncharacterized glyoxalase superfamily protein PhnB
MTFSPVGLTPLLGVFDMTRSLAFYRDRLGFEVVMASPEVETAEGRFSHWILLRHGAAELMLNTQYDSNERPASPDRGRQAGHTDVCLFIGCADIDAAYRELSGRGLKADPPELAPYGLKTFSVSDPDGYLVVYQEHR